MSGQITMRRVGSSLVPCAQLDERDLLEFPEKKDLSVTIKRARSPKNHRFFWALLQIVCENTDTYETPEKLLLWLKIRLGYVERVTFHNGDVWWTAKSTSFSAMGQDEFRKFFDLCVETIVREVIPGMATESLISEVEQMIGIKFSEIWKDQHGVRNQK